MSRSYSQDGGRYECFQNFTGTPTGKRSLGRSRRRWKNNIRMDLKQIDIPRIDSAQDKD